MTLTAPGVLLLPPAAGAQPCLWEQVPAATVGSAENNFFGIDGTSSSDVWAVGLAVYSVPGGSREYQTLIEHFDGSTWSDAGAPNPGGFTRTHWLWDVVAAAPDAAWAVGSYQPPTIGTAEQPLFLAWDGSSWEHEPAPQYPGGGNFHGVMTTGGDIWTTGTRVSPASPIEAVLQGFVARWDGSQWRDELLPRLALFGRYGDTPRAIDGVSASDLWVVGAAHQTTGGSHGGFGPTRYVAHFDGSEWRLVDAPEPNPDFTILSDVEAVASDDVWAVGYYTDFASSSQQPYLIHWDGGEWTMVDLPEFPDGGAILWSVTARAADDVYAAGATLSETGLPTPMVMRFDGDQWSVMDVALGGGQFRAVAALPTGDVWAAGLPQLTARMVCESGCYADCTGEGDLDIFDFICFQDAFVAGDPYADCTGEGTLDIFDFICFQDAFVGGCP